MKTLARHVLLMLAYGTGGVLLAVLAGAIVYLEGRQDLSPWHQVVLDEEFSVESDVTSFAEYLALEDRLFQATDEAFSDGGLGPLNRFNPTSIASPERWTRNWNRSFELDVAAPKAGALLLHGMSDSPYSLRALAESLHADGVQVLGLRYPGHGTAPSNLTRTSWEDMAAAVHLAARHLAEKLDGAPLYVFGYSTGGPLAVELALMARDDDELPMPDGIVMLSPAMGVTGLAALTPWQDRLGRILGLEKFAWNSLSIEYDPFKYRSFPLNAAIQVWRLSNHVAGRVAAASASGALVGMPPVLTFQSVVDDTVAVPALLNAFYNHLPEGGHAIVAFDINRRAGMETLLAADPGPALQTLLEDDARRFDLLLVSNQPGVDGPVTLQIDRAGEMGLTRCPLPERWPDEAYSLTHIALPFPPEDPLYGGPDATPYPGINLGDVVLRGEGSALQVSPAGFLRQTWNPFYATQLALTRQFMNLTTRGVCPHG